MLKENIRRLRKDKGYSQETLAEALGVVRQTVSKWEKGLSVPDADLLEKMAELLEVDVNTLLGASLPSESERNSLDEIAKQLAVFNERSASNINKRRMIKKYLFIGLGIFIAIILAIIILAQLCKAYLKDDMHTITDQKIESYVVECKSDEETYHYEIDYDRNDDVLSIASLNNPSDLKLDTSLKASYLLEIITDYHQKRGVACHIQYE